MNSQNEKVLEVLNRYMEGTYTADIPMLSGRPAADRHPGALF